MLWTLILFSLLKPQGYIYITPEVKDTVEVTVATVLPASKFLTFKGRGSAEIAVEVKSGKSDVIFGTFWYVKFKKGGQKVVTKSFKIPVSKKWQTLLRISNSITGEVVYEKKWKYELDDYVKNGYFLGDPVPEKGYPVFEGDTISFHFKAITEPSKIEVTIRLLENQKGFDVPVRGVVLSPIVQRKGKGEFTVKFFMPDTLARGEYIAGLKIVLDGIKFERKAKFIYKKGGSVLVGNLDNYIPALIYIAPYSEVKKIERAPDSLKMDLWKEFWKKHDPTPGTPENELMEEFVERVTYANKNFSIGRMLGALTDRGHVYIKLGPPDEIDNHPFDVNALPYQVWYYYDRNLTIIFVDRGGFGDYELYYPADLFDRIN